MHVSGVTESYLGWGRKEGSDLRMSGGGGG